MFLRFTTCKSILYLFSHFLLTISRSSGEYEEILTGDCRIFPEGYYIPDLQQNSIVLDEPPQRSNQTETAHSESSSSSDPRSLPLDELLCFGSDSSDEEMEADSSTTATTPTPSEPLGFVRCLWEGCNAELSAGTPNDVWKEHIKKHCVQSRGEDRGRRAKVIYCRWGKCTKSSKQLQGFLKHADTHIRETKLCPRSL